MTQVHKIAYDLSTFLKEGVTQVVGIAEVSLFFVITFNSLILKLFFCFASAMPKYFSIFFQDFFTAGLKQQ